MKVSANRIRKLTSFSGTLKIMVLGDLMIDKYIFGKGIRLSSEAAVPVLQVSREEYRLGGAANIAYHLKNLGIDVNLCGIVGYDDAGQQLRNRIVQARIPAGGIFPSSNRPTPQKVRVISMEHSQLLSRFDYEKRKVLSSEEETSVIQYLKVYSDDMKALVMADHDMGLFRTNDFINELKVLCEKNHIMSFAEVRKGHPDRFQWCDHVITNDFIVHEFLVNKTKEDIQDLKQLGMRIMEILPMKTLIIYNSLHQLIGLFRKDRDPFIYGNLPTQVRDQTGSGDIVTAIVALGIVSGAEPEESVVMAQRGIRTAGQQLGTGLISINDLLI